MIRTDATETPRRLIETDSFPFEFISVLAEKESWRKEIYRPIYHIHKWWAQRLGSVFRGILLGSVIPEDGNLRDQFYQTHDFRGVSVLDPFMGSGTTVGEAHKLGFTALGRDINPVACEGVRVAMGALDRQSIIDAFSYLGERVGTGIRELYRSRDEKGQKCDVLYYFWVKNIPCPSCAARVDLFTTRVVARNAYPDRKPEIQVSCPGCGEIFPATNYDTRVHCPRCKLDFDPNSGPANGTEAVCSTCSKPFRIAEAIRTGNQPPLHRLYGKLLLTPTGEKRYLSATPEDLESYQECSRLLRLEVADGKIRLPNAVLTDGYNTRQAIGYNYNAWRDFFNDRQLLALGRLQQAISTLPNTSTREAFLTLFSGVLEFNNLFASYKGEGTGAVRHMFAHHILKPERTPIEANVWGTYKSSGSFSNVFKARLMRLLDYRDAPFEVSDTPNHRVYAAGVSFSGELSPWPGQGGFRPQGIHLSCGSSDATGLPDRSIDLVVTDPPFFDNVHYSELADFFHAWQSLYPHGFIGESATTRHPSEVQDADQNRFSAKLKSVFTECHRILKDEGLLVFTYHHSRPEGWTSLVSAIAGARFSVVNAHPVKAELSVAAPKSQAKEPIQLDMILVCKKLEMDKRDPVSVPAALEMAISTSIQKAARLTSAGFRLSLNDRRIILMSQFIAILGPANLKETSLNAIEANQAAIEAAAIALCAKPVVRTSSPDHSNSGQIPLPI